MWGTNCENFHIRLQDYLGFKVILALTPRFHKWVLTFSCFAIRDTAVCLRVIVPIAWVSLLKESAVT
ncbi:unnamed protein product [Blepharisma stoltei]|uniref:Uncharacterized protein n=1 Tax=Blepharisma stoltei TaxID=1481888 RepID=A0AAU9JL96_9CILI|nr:unnamed protein product [Blepharisma stoltei]